MAGHQKFGADSIGALINTGIATVQLAASEITIGGLQYTSGNLVVDTAVSGAGGLDTGSIAANTLYYIYSIVDSSNSALVLSTSSSAPTGFTSSQEIGGVYTNDSSELDTPFKKGEEKNQSKTKLLSADISSVQDIADLQFDNLIIGKMYTVNGSLRLHTSGSGTNTVHFRSAAAGAGTLYGKAQDQESTASASDIVAVSFTFPATSTTLFVRAVTVDLVIAGNGTKDETFITLTELNDTEETDRF